MKILIKRIPREQEEEARLFVHEEDEGIKQLAEYVEKEQFRKEQLICQKEDAICRLSCREIYYIETMGDVQEVHSKSGCYMTRKRLYILERELPEYFVRVSKSAIINLQLVKEYHPKPGGMMTAEFSTGDEVYISRKYLREIRERIWEERL